MCIGWCDHFMGWNSWWVFFHQNQRRNMHSSSSTSLIWRSILITTQLRICLLYIIVYSPILRVKRFMWMVLWSELNLYPHCSSMMIRMVLLFMWIGAYQKRIIQIYKEILLWRCYYCWFLLRWDSIWIQSRSNDWGTWSSSHSCWDYYPCSGDLCCDTCLWNCDLLYSNL